ncbi:hypothetical protein [Methylibium rhizosphaerae]|uniref:hypothetical protein n=1 Tax=Methylibium rhizosphaerae TaxID=2570323 RepID=UPI00112AECD4|nr:hypothetical protein [Methylibium rhizosphaerae]
MGTTTSLIIAACSGATVAALAAWWLTRRHYGAHLQQLQVRYTQLHTAAVQFEKDARRQVGSLQAELAVQRASTQSAREIAEQRRRKAALEAALAEEASKPSTDCTLFPDTEPLAPWAPKAR